MKGMPCHSPSGWAFSAQKRCRSASASARKIPESGTNDGVDDTYYSSIICGIFLRLFDEKSSTAVFLIPAAEIPCAGVF